MSWGKETKRDLCAAVRQACVEGEQVVLRERAQLDAALEALQEAKEPMSVFRTAATEARPSLLVARPGQRYDYLPLGINYKMARIHSNSRAWGHRLWLNRTASAPTGYRADAVGLIFFTTFPTSFAETFARSVSRVEQATRVLQRRHPTSRLHLIPAMWGRSLEPLLAPFGDGAVRPLGALANVSGQQTRKLYNALPEPDTWRAYMQQQQQVATQPPRCFERAYVCDFHAMPGRGTVLGTRRVQAAWQAAQRILRHVAGEEWRPERPSPPLVRVVVFARRAGRRRLSNLDKLLARCKKEGPRLSTKDKRINGLVCESFDLGTGIRSAWRVLSRADVLVAPHGGDLTNGLFMRAGAAVLEILPVWGGAGQGTRKGRKGPANGKEAFGRFFYDLFAEQPVCIQQLFTRNASYSRARMPGTAGSYNEDLSIPWEVLRPRLLSPPAPTMPVDISRGADHPGCMRRTPIQYF